MAAICLWASKAENADAPNRDNTYPRHNELAKTVTFLLGFHIRLWSRMDEKWSPSSWKSKPVAQVSVVIGTLTYSSVADSQMPRMSLIPIKITSKGTILLVPIVLSFVKFKRHLHDTGYYPNLQRCLQWSPHLRSVNC